MGSSAKNGDRKRRTQPMGNADEAALEDNMDKCNPRDLSRLGTGWSVEEAEVAAQDRSIWKRLKSGSRCRNA